jgi:hypothetical protein
MQQNAMQFPTFLKKAELLSAVVLVVAESASEQRSSEGLTS